MARLVSFLMILALVLTNGAAVASATCQHVDAQAHASARQSSDARVAASALTEEAAAATVSKKAALADAAAVQLAGFLVPTEPVLPLPRPLKASQRRAAEAGKLPSIASRPLLEPPLA